MGFAPEQVKRMTLWEFSACISAWRTFNGINEEKTATIDRLHELGVE